jgi:antitoxin (DNA-binding transcriptional repressor) of toxin-antitoxin stability system
MTKLITVTEIMRSFSDVVGRVYYKGESFDIKKGANIVARLSPAKKRSTIAIKDLNNFFQNAPHLGKSDIEDFENTINEVKSKKENGVFNKWD